MCVESWEKDIFEFRTEKNNITRRNNMPQPYETSIYSPGPSDLL